jgi:hypothetical protein
MHCALVSWPLEDGLQPLMSPASWKSTSQGDMLSGVVDASVQVPPPLLEPLVDPLLDPLPDPLLEPPEVLPEELEG